MRSGEKKTRSQVGAGSAPGWFWVCFVGLGRLCGGFGMALGWVWDGFGCSFFDSPCKTMQSHMDIMSKSHF